MIHKLIFKIQLLIMSIVHFGFVVSAAWLVIILSIFYAKFCSKYKNKKNSTGIAFGMVGALCLASGAKIGGLNIDFSEKTLPAQAGKVWEFCGWLFLLLSFLIQFLNTLDHSKLSNIRSKIKNYFLISKTK